IDSRCNTVRPGSNSFAKLSYCVCISLCLEGDLAARKIHALACYQITQTIHERICYAHADRSLLCQVSFRFLSVAETAISHRERIVNTIGVRHLGQCFLEMAHRFSV